LEVLKVDHDQARVPPCTILQQQQPPSPNSRKCLDTYGYGSL